MSLIDDATTDAGDSAGTQAQDRPGASSNFGFVPKELAGRCRALIESYHAMHGYGCLPDMLWQSDAHNFIERRDDLRRIFKDAAKSRRAKPANEWLTFIATTVVSLEALARDFAGWGKRFPAAKQQAERLLGDYPLGRHIWFMDLYLYPLAFHHRAASTPAPASATAEASAPN